MRCTVLTVQMPFWKQPTTVVLLMIPRIIDRKGNEDMIDTNTMPHLQSVLAGNFQYTVMSRVTDDQGLSRFLTDEECRQWIDLQEQILAVHQEPATWDMQETMLQNQTTRYLLDHRNRLGVPVEGNSLGVYPDGTIIRPFEVHATVKQTQVFDVVLYVNTTTPMSAYNQLLYVKPKDLMNLADGVRTIAPPVCTLEGGLHVTEIEDHPVPAPDDPR
jgi:hypothetical protein